METVIFSPALEDLSARLTDEWEQAQVSRLPFPISYLLVRLRQEGYPWDFLLKDMLQAVLQYLAVVGISEYLQVGEEADYDLNEAIQKLGGLVSQGHWMEMVRRCAKRRGGRLLEGYAEGFAAVEEGRCKARLEFERYGISTGSQGLLSTWVTARNKLFGHNRSLSDGEKGELRPKFVVLMRAVLELLGPVWKYRLGHTFEVGVRRHTLALMGVSGFGAMERPDLPADAGSFVEYGGKGLALRPLLYADSPPRGHTVTIVDEESEVYLLNNIERSRVPWYAGVNGELVERRELGEQLNGVLEQKRVWESRRDIKLDRVLGYVVQKTREELASAEENNQYDAAGFVLREGFRKVLEEFLASEKSALVVAGESGCGKTSAVIDAVRRLVDRGSVVYLVRAAALSGEVQKPKALGRWLTARFGYEGQLSEVVGRAGTLVLVVDGLNDFGGAGRDPSLLFRAINQLIADQGEGGSLKVVMTVRSDMLNVFLPGGRLPADADEDRYFLVEGMARYELGAFSDEECRRLLVGMGMTAEAVEGTVGKLKAENRSPVILRKIALGVIGGEDLGHLEGRDITGRFLRWRIGKDRELRGIVEGLVQLMNKTGDLRVSQEVIRRRAPKLFKALTGEGNRKLSVLRDLEVVQVLDQVDETGLPTWAVSFSHDSIFEALAAQQKRKMLFNTLASDAFSAALVVLFGLGCYRVVAGAFNAKASSGLARLLEQAELNLQSISPNPDLERAYRVLYSAASENLNAMSDIIGWIFIRLGLTALLPLLVLFMVFKFLSFLISRADRRDARMLYFARAYGARQSRRYQPPIAILALLAVAATLILFVVSLRVPLSSFMIVLPLLILLSLLLLLLPLLSLGSLMSIRRKTKYLWEFYLSSVSLRKRLFEDLRMLSMCLLPGALLVSLALFPPAFFFPSNRAARHEAGLSRLLSVDEIRFLQQTALPNVDKDTLLRTARGDTFQTTMKELKDVSAGSHEVARVFAWAVFGMLIYISISLAIGLVFVAVNSGRPYVAPREQGDRHMAAAAGSGG